MGKIEDYIAKLKTVDQKKVDEAVLTIIRKHEAQLVDLNTRQLLAGENADGGLLGTYRNEHYKRFKESLNPAAGGKVDTKLTGAFQESFFLEADKWPVMVFATDSKTGKLSEMYDKIFGWAPKSIVEIQEDVRNESIEAVQSMLLL